MANWAATLARVLSEMTINPPPELLRSLREGGERLSTLTDEFKQLLEIRALSIFSFYETVTMRFKRNLVRVPLMAQLNRLIRDL